MAPFGEPSDRRYNPFNPFFTPHQEENPPPYSADSSTPASRTGKQILSNNSSKLAANETASSFSSHYNNPFVPAPRTATTTPSNDDARSVRSSTAPPVFHIYIASSFTSNYNIYDSAKRPLYHLHISNWTPRKPDLTLHSGTNDKSPALAVARYVSFSSTIKVGLGDPKADPGGTIWEDVKRVSWIHGSYRCELDVVIRSPDSDAYTTERRGFLWKPMQGVGAGDSKPSTWSWTNYKMVEERTGEIVAVFEDSTLKSVKKKGILEIRRDFGRAFDIMALISGMAIVNEDEGD